ncbi:MAG TPA: GxxExxY protein [Polyangiaceae bacterium]|nr:GxxExxY protein [Polyangiaceae bacterium]
MNVDRNSNAERSTLVEPGQRVNDAARVVIESALDVHKVLGPGFGESIYEEALAIELTRRAVPFKRQAPFAIQYKGCCVGEGRVDLLVDERLIVELKSVEALAPVHIAQTISYLKALRNPLGLLINFNVHRLRTGVRRVVLSRS